MLGVSFAYVLAVATVVWRRFNGGWGLRVGEAADGLRLRFGALETTAETIPRGRVQALVRTEPVAWRPWGWVRLQLAVAGHARNREERQSDTRELRTVVPAGGTAEADVLLDRVLPDRPVQLLPPPARARWKAPLRYHWLGVGWNGAAVVVTGGRLTRRTTWVPLARVQSLRLVQGPVQRRLRLASVHVDAAGRRMTAVAHDRDVDEAQRLLAELAEACRAARVPLHRPDPVSAESPAARPNPRSAARGDLDIAKCVSAPTLLTRYHGCSRRRPPAPRGSRVLRLRVDVSIGTRQFARPRSGAPRASRCDLAAGAHPHLGAVPPHQATSASSPGRTACPDLEELVADPLPALGSWNPCRRRRSGSPYHPVDVDELGTRSGWRRRSSIATKPECEAAQGTICLTPAASATASASATISSSPKSPPGSSEPPWPRQSKLRTRRRRLRSCAAFDQRSFVEHQPVIIISAGSPSPRSS